MSNFPLRLPETLMDDAREMANAEGVSINQFLATLIAVVSRLVVYERGLVTMIAGRFGPGVRPGLPAG